MPHTPFPGGRRVRCEWLLSLVLGVVAPAASQPAPTFSCDGDHATVSSGLTLARYTPPRAVKAAAAHERQWRFGPFDRTTFGFDRVSFFVDEAGPFDDGYGGVYGPIDLVVALDGGAGGWFRLVPAESPEARRGNLRGYRNISNDHTILSQAATPDLPIFAFTVAERAGRSEAASTYVVDLRPDRRSVQIELECWEAVNQGACLTWDKVYQQSAERWSCQWSSERNDILCMVRTDLQVPWSAPRVSEVTEALLDRAPKPESPPSAELFADFVRRFAAGKAASPEWLPGWGLVAGVLAVHGPDGSSTIVVAQPGRTSSFDTEFLAVTIGADDAVSRMGVPTTEIAPEYWNSVDELDHTVTTLPGIPHPEEWDVTGRVLTETPTWILARVVVSEGEGDALYWIGIDRSDKQKPTTAAVRLSTNAIDYFRCARAATPPNVIEVELAGSFPLVAALDIEPPRPVDMFTREPVSDEKFEEFAFPKCPTRARLQWSGGFVLIEEPSPPCDTPVRPRFVQIRPNGSIVAMPRLPFPRQP